MTEWFVRPVLLVALMLLAGCTAVDGLGIVGTPPRYGPGGVGALPNAAAIGPRIWVPGLDEAFVPQGLAVARDDVLVAGFRSADLSVGKGPCRVYRIDAASGQVRGSFALPFPDDPARYGERDDCGHAGGLAVAEDGTLFVADTRLLFVTTLDAFTQPTPTFRKIKLEDKSGTPGLKGGLAGFGRGSLWLGASETAGSARLFRFDLGRVKDKPDGQPLGAEDVLSSTPLPTYAQGVAIDPDDGSLWITRSDLGWACLEQRDPATGATLARYELPAATEGIAFGRGRRLWAVSEAGARRFYESLPTRLLFPFHPLIYAIDIARLQPR